MTSVVQQFYAPQMAPWVVGMIPDQTDYEVASRQVETTAGLPFGVAVSQGTKDRGVILGGSKFVGVTIKDINFASGTAFNSLSNTTFAADIVPNTANIGVITRGHVIVVAGSDVAAWDAAFYSTTTGGFSNSASGLAASGNVVFTTQPAVGQTVTINGSAISFIANGATPSGLQVPLGNTLGDTVQALATFANGSSDTGLVALTYSAFPPSPGGSGQGSGSNTLLIADKTVGTAGNALTLATNVTGATVSGATLAGGTASATAITGARFITSAIAGQMVKLALSAQL